MSKFLHISILITFEQLIKIITTQSTMFLGAFCQMSIMNIQIMFTLIRKNNDDKQRLFFSKRIFII